MNVLTVWMAVLRYATTLKEALMIMEEIVQLQVSRLCVVRFVATLLKEAYFECDCSDGFILNDTGKCVKKQYGIV